MLKNYKELKVRKEILSALFGGLQDKCKISERSKIRSNLPDKTGICVGAFKISREQALEPLNP